MDRNLKAQCIEAFSMASQDRNLEAQCIKAFSMASQAQNHASANCEEPSSPAHDGHRDSRWLRTLSDPELDFLISLKDLAMTHATNASLAMFANEYDLQMLRVLGIVLLETLKERLKGTSINPSIFDRLALLSDSNVHFLTGGSDFESEGLMSKAEETPMGVNEKRKQMQASGWISEEGRKKRKSASQDSSEHR